jgi:hypothetical protein
MRAPLVQINKKKSDSFRWTEEMQKVLDDLKALISKPPILASLEPGETLLLYVTTTPQVISAALVVEREELGHVYKVQRAVSYISKVLSDCETCYNQVQKNTLCSLNYEAQALTLLREPLDPCGDLIWAQRNCWELSHHGKDH